MMFSLDVISSGAPSRATTSASDVLPRSMNVTSSGVIRSLILSLRHWQAVSISRTITWHSPAATRLQRGNRSITEGPDLKLEAIRPLAEHHFIDYPLTVEKDIQMVAHDVEP